MNKREAGYQTILNQYLREKKMYCYYELKQVIGNAFSFSKIRVGQDAGLPALQKSGLTWKWSDEDSREKPCDGACLPPLPSYLIIKFNDGFYFINYDKILEMKFEGRIGITKAQAKKVADKIIQT